MEYFNNNKFDKFITHYVTVETYQRNLFITNEITFEFEPHTINIAKA